MGHRRVRDPNGIRFRSRLSDAVVIGSLTWINDGRSGVRQNCRMWPFRSRSRPDPIARADAAALVALLGDAALDHARRQVVAQIRGPTDDMWPPGHWHRVRREVRATLGLDGAGRRTRATSDQALQ